MKKILLLGVLTSLVVYFTIPLFGTSDMSAWVRSGAVNLEYGPAKAYNVYNMYYPPLSSTIIWVTAKISNFSYQPSWLVDYQTPQIIARNYLPFKYSILAFLILSLLLLKVSIKDKLLIFLNPAILWITLVLGYIDIYIAPSLILTYYFYRQKKNFLSGCFFAITFLIKLIPIFLIPVFLFSYIDLNLKPFKIHFKIKSALSFVIGMLTTSALTFLMYDFNEFLKIIFMSAGHGQYLSANAMNVYWLIRQFFIPSNIAPHWIAYTGKILFLATGGLSLLNLVLSKEKIEALLRCSFAILLSYAMLFTGAHENHLFPALILSILLYHEYHRHNYKIWYYGISTIIFVNLFLFYGFGQGASVSWLYFILKNESLKQMLIDLGSIGAISLYLHVIYSEYKDVKRYL